MEAHEHEYNLKEDFSLPGKIKWGAIGAAILGLILAVVGMMVNPQGRLHEADMHVTKDLEQQQPIHDEAGVDEEIHPPMEHNVNESVPAEHPHEAPENIPQKRIWANLMLGAFYFFLIALGGSFFVAMNYLANAGWATALKRIPEAMGGFIPVAGVVLLIILFGGAHYLYHWTHETLYDPDAYPDEYDPLLEGKRPFLKVGVIGVIVAVFVAIMTLLTMLLRSYSKKEDDAPAGTLKWYNKSMTVSVLFLVLFAIGISFFSWGYVMSTNPHWYSTMYAVYVFAGMFVGALTVITMIAILLKKAGYMAAVNDDHIHDMGKFMFAFSIFWAYIWVAQYLLIWYANIPEETIYFDARLEGPWAYLFWGNVIINFAFPLLILMSRHTKRHFEWLFAVGIIILIGRYTDWYLLIMPDTVGLQASTFGMVEIGVWLFFAGVFTLFTGWMLTRANLLPRNHPYIQESVHHEIPV